MIEIIFQDVLFQIKQKTTYDFEHPYVLVYHGRITGIKLVLYVLLIILETNNNLVISVEDIKSGVLMTLLLNKLRKNLKNVGIKITRFLLIKNNKY